MELISHAKVIFWDFDGVIKESIQVKTDAFVELFRPYGKEVADRVREHHQKNGGVSRFKKIPLYLQWAGQEASASEVEDFYARFEKMVLQAVIDAPWVPGVESFLRSNPYHQKFIVVSATPQAELTQILQALDLSKCFAAVFGAPTSKQDGIRNSIIEDKLLSGDCLMIGDALADLEAAEANDVPFLLRRHDANTALFSGYTGQSVKDFSKL
jgi:phosphoglycolate phosphatase-like HAD superfamily hydrolase